MQSRFILRNLLKKMLTLIDELQRMRLEWVCQLSPLT
jgi:hypothetical protein